MMVEASERGRKTTEILRWRFSKRLLKHGYEGRHRLIAEIGRYLLHTRARDQLSHCHDQVQQLTPAPERQACLLDDESRQTALPVEADGIAYHARHDDTELCYALFDRSGDAITMEAHEIDLDQDWFWQIADRYRVGLAP